MLLNIYQTEFSQIFSYVSTDEQAGYKHDMLSQEMDLSVCFDFMKNTRSNNKHWYCRLNLLVIV